MISHKSLGSSADAASLTIKASKIEPLSAFLKHNKKHLEYSEMEQFIEMIGRQLHHLETEQNKGVSSFKLDDITVFHDTDPYAVIPTPVYFAITNDDNIYDIDEENQMEITSPVLSLQASTKHKIAFHSPEYKEFISKKTIPYKIHFKSGYYSFGLLCLYCYVNRTPAVADAVAVADADADADADAVAVADAEFETIINTKIYWFLKQVLQKDPSSRRYICV
jgi:hypothetical protein